MASGFLLIVMARRLRGSDKFRGKVYRTIIREVVLWSLLAFALINALLMVWFFVAGIVEAGKGCAVFFHLIPPPREFISSEEAAMALGLKAIEFFLLAPLGYLFTSALAAFIQALVDKGGDSWTAALRALVGLKSLATSMLLSIIAVDFVSKVLTGSKLALMNSFIEGGFFLLLVAYLVVLERTHRKQQAARHDQSPADRRRTTSKLLRRID